EGPRDSVPDPARNAMDYCGFSGFFGNGRFEGSNQSMADLAGALSQLLGRIVVDKTGIAGTFRIQLTYAPDDSVVRFPDPVGRPFDAAPPDAGPSVFAAV